jgi:hypothetical protein
MRSLDAWVWCRVIVWMFEILCGGCIRWEISWAGCGFGESRFNLFELTIEMVLEIIRNPFQTLTP